jgi:hypothetical protein
MPNKNEDNGSSVSTISDAQALFNLELNDLDRISALIYSPGLGYFFNVADETEYTISLEQADIATLTLDAQLNYDIARKLTDINWIYVLSTLFTLYTTTERRKLLESLPDTPSKEKRINGRDMFTFSTYLILIGYMLGAKGLELIAEGSLEAQRESPPP